MHCAAIWKVIRGWLTPQHHVILCHVLRGWSGVCSYLEGDSWLVDSAAAQQNDAGEQGGAERVHNSRSAGAAHASDSVTEALDESSQQHIVLEPTCQQGHC